MPSQAYTTILNHIVDLQRMNAGCGQRHHDAMGHVAHEATHEKALSLLLQGLALYAEAYEKRYESKLGTDCVLGEEWLDMARGFTGLLNGELGHLDGGTLDGTIRDLALEAGFDEEL
jgi:hypothetical protein